LILHLSDITTNHKNGGAGEGVNYPKMEGEMVKKMTLETRTNTTKSNYLSLRATRRILKTNYVL
jgi:hypothetical protein